MRGLAGDLHVVAHGTGHQVPADPAEFADRDGRIDMHAEAAVDMQAVVKRILQQGAKTFAAFFTALKHQDYPARDFVFNALETLGSTQQHRRVAVMAAGVGNSFHFGHNRLFNAAGVDFRFPDRQGIDVGSQQDRAAFRLIAQESEDAAERDINMLDAEGFQFLADLRNRIFFLIGKFRMLMQVAAVFGNV